MESTEVDRGVVNGVPSGGAGIEQALMLLVQQALVPFASRVAALEDELRAIRAALPEQATIAATASQESVNQPEDPAEVLYDPGLHRQGNMGYNGNSAGLLTAARGVSASPSMSGNASPDGCIAGPVTIVTRASTEIAAAASSVMLASPPPLPLQHNAQRQPSSDERASNGVGSAGRLDVGSVRSLDADDGLRQQDPTVANLAHRLQEVQPESRKIIGERAVQQDSVGSLNVSEHSAKQQGVMAHAAVFFDFDSTLSTPRYLDRAKDYALADRPALCASMSRPEILANFGGPGRVARLHALLQRLSAKGVALFIISLGYTEAIKHQLAAIGLGRFFPVGHVFGQDAPDLSQSQHRKAVLIQRLMELNRWTEDHVLFVDDDEGHIGLCRDMSVCRTLMVRGEGLSLEEIERIEATASGWS